MDKVAKTLEWLDENHVNYEVIHHPAVFTVEDVLREIDAERHDFVCKNLFLRDFKGKRHFILTCANDKTVDLKELGEKAGVRFSFASEERLLKHLSLTKGSVTPLGVLFDTDASVEVMFDASLAVQQKVGVHPCENTATVFLDYADLEQLVKKHGNSVSIVQL
jgi:Uncharacterized conserved protein